MMKNVFSCLILLLLVSCNRNQIIDNGGISIGNFCYSFDVRQCGTDLYASEVLESGSIEEREEMMMSWLEDQGASVVSLKLHKDFHESVCEACDICPQGDRYFVSFSENGIADGDKLRLLNYEKIDNTQCQ